MADNDAVQPTEGYSYRYDDSKKSTQALGASDRGVIGVRVIPVGQSSTTEHHPEVDTIAFVKAGNAKVTSGDALIGELRKDDVIVLPADTQYTFEALPGDDVEIIQFYAAHTTLPASFKPFS